MIPRGCRKSLPLAGPALALPSPREFHECSLRDDRSCPVRRVRADLHHAGNNPPPQAVAACCYFASLTAKSRSLDAAIPTATYEQWSNGPSVRPKIQGRFRSLGFRLPRPSKCLGTRARALFARSPRESGKISRGCPRDYPRYRYGSIGSICTAAAPPSGRCLKKQRWMRSCDLAARILRSEIAFSLLEPRVGRATSLGLRYVHPRSS